MIVVLEAVFNMFVVGAVISVVVVTKLELHCRSWWCVIVVMLWSDVGSLLLLTCC